MQLTYLSNICENINEMAFLASMKNPEFYVDDFDDKKRPERKKEDFVYYARDLENVLKILAVDSRGQEKILKDKKVINAVEGIYHIFNYLGIIGKYPDNEIFKDL